MGHWFCQKIHLDFQEIDGQFGDKYDKIYGGDYKYLGTVGIRSEIYPIYEHETQDVGKIIMTHSGLRLFGVVSYYKSSISN